MFPLKAVIASGTEDAQDAGRRRRGNSVAPVDVHEARRRLVTAATRARRGLFEIAVDQGLFHDVLAHRITRLHRQGDFADGLRELAEDPSLREFSRSTSGRCGSSRRWKRWMLTVPDQFPGCCLGTGVSCSSSATAGRSPDSAGRNIRSRVTSLRLWRRC